MRRKKLIRIGLFARGLILAAATSGLIVSAHYIMAPPPPDRIDAAEMARAALLHPLAPGVTSWSNLRNQLRPIVSQSAILDTGSVQALWRRVRTFDVIKPTGDETSTRLTHAIQTELQRLGCYSGRSHGTWNTPTNIAMEAFLHGTGGRLQIAGPRFALLTLLQAGEYSASNSPCLNPSQQQRPRMAAIVVDNTVEQPDAMDSTSLSKDEIGSIGAGGKISAPIISLPAGLPVIVAPPPPITAAVADVGRTRTQAQVTKEVGREKSPANVSTTEFGVRRAKSDGPIAEGEPTLPPIRNGRPTQITTTTTRLRQ